MITMTFACRISVSLETVPKIAPRLSLSPFLSMSSRTTTAPLISFTGPAEGHDSAIVSAGVSVIWTPLTTYLNYDGQLGRGNYSSNAVTGGVRIAY
jgi:hypothetical protein